MVFEFKLATIVVPLFCILVAVSAVTVVVVPLIVPLLTKFETVRELPKFDAAVTPTPPRTSNVPAGDCVPRPNLLLVSSQKRLAVSPLNVLPAPANCIVPAAPKLGVLTAEVV